MNQQFYQVGGSLPANSKSYIKRKADDILYKYLKEGKYCYVLNARQVGKSSLRVHVSKKLEEEGYSCVNIDLTSIGGSENIEASAWYLSFVFEIIQQLNLDMDKFIAWWEKHEKLTTKLTVVKLFGEIFDEVVLQDQDKKIVIFIDEVDSILGMKKDFSADDFFAVIRTFYNLRSEDERYNRVSFALFGVATPEDLMRDSTRTPFNIAHSVKLNQFQLKESLMLAEGLADNSVNSEKILEKIFEWTDGTPYLTQKILDYISQNPISSVDEVDDIVDILFIKENFKEINISNVLNRIINNTEYNVKMLYMIDELIAKKLVKADDSRKQQIYLKLSGLVKEENGELFFSNKIYEKVFNKVWLNESIEKIDRPLTKDLQRWIELEKSTSALLQGEVLSNVKEWAENRDDISSIESEYLRLSSEFESDLEKRSIIDEEKRKGDSKLIKFLIPALVLVSILGYYLFVNREELKSTNNKLEKLKIKNIDITLSEKDKNNELPAWLTESIKDNNTTTNDTNLTKKDNNVTEKDYNITKNYTSTIKIDENEVIESGDVKHNGTTFYIAKESQQKYKKLIKLILVTESMDDDERQYWFDIMPSMTDSQINRLYVILETEKKKLEKLEVKYQDEIKSLNEKHLIEWQEFQTKKILDGNISEENIGDLISAIESNKDIATYLKIKNKLNTLRKNNEISKEYNLYLNAVLFRNIKDYDNAILNYQQLIKLYDIENFSNYSEKEMSLIIDIHGKLSTIYEDDNKVDEALIWKNKTMSLIKLLVKKFPTKENLEKRFEFSKKVIRILGSNERYKDAVTHLNKQVSFIKKYKNILYSNDEDKYNNELLKLYNELAWNYNRNGNFKESIKLYEKAIALNPKKDYLYRNMAGTYLNHNKYEKAIELYKKAISLDDKDSSTYYAMAYTYGENKDFKNAINMYEKAIEIDNTNKSAYTNMFELQVAQNLPFDVELEKQFLEIVKEKREELIYYDMMKIFKDIINKKEVNLNNWSKKYSDVKSDWGFDLTDNWIKTIKDKDIKFKLLEATDIFKNHNKKEK